MSGFRILIAWVLAYAAGYVSGCLFRIHWRAR